MRLLILVALLSGCTPFAYVLKNAPARPTFDAPAEPLMRPSLDATDCPRFVFDDGSWQRQSWDPDLGLAELITDTVVPGELHPAAPLGTASCRHAIVPSGWWAAGKEALRRYPEARIQVQALETYTTLILDTWESESKRLGEAGKQAKLGQIRAALIGGGVGAGTVLLTVLAFVLGGG